MSHSEKGCPGRGRRQQDSATRSSAGLMRHLSGISVQEASENAINGEVNGVAIEEERREEYAREAGKVE